MNVVLLKQKFKGMRRVESLEYSPGQSFAFEDYAVRRFYGVTAEFAFLKSLELLYYADISRRKCDL